jgi:hypothetical protein
MVQASSFNCGLPVTHGQSVSVSVCATRKIEPRAHFVFIICGSQPLMIFNWHFFSVDGLPAEVSERANGSSAWDTKARLCFGRYAISFCLLAGCGTQKLYTGHWIGRSGNRRRVPARQVAYACTSQALTSPRCAQVEGEPSFENGNANRCSVVVLILWKSGSPSQFLMRKMRCKYRWDRARSK